MAASNATTQSCMRRRGRSHPGSPAGSRHISGRGRHASRRNGPHHLFGRTCRGHSRSPFRVAHQRPLERADLAEGRLKPRPPMPQWRVARFFPWASPFLAQPRNARLRHPPLCCGRKRCGGGRLRPDDRHRGRMVRARKRRKRRLKMATIGTFKGGALITFSFCRRCSIHP